MMEVNIYDCAPDCIRKVEKRGTIWKKRKSAKCSGITNAEFRISDFELQVTRFEPECHYDVCPP